MIYRMLFFAACFLCPLNSLAIDAAISYAAFQTPDKAYLELYLRINRRDITFTPTPDGMVQAHADIQVQFFRKGVETLTDRFQVSSPLAKRSVDFIALQRYPLADGQYDLILEISDAANPENSRRYRTSLEIQFENDALVQSDISLLADIHATDALGPLVRNGMHMEPLPNRYYGPKSDRLFFYHEIYHADRFIGKDFVLTYAVEALQNGAITRIIERHKRQSPQDIISLYGQLDINELPSGFYQLAIELRDPQKKLISQKMIFFQRSNPGIWQREGWITSFDPSQTFVGDIPEDSLAYSLRALGPVLPPMEMESVNWLLKIKDIKSQQAFLYAYWTDRYPDQASVAYQDYMNIAKAVDLQFKSGFRYGFETDRGYIYLKYGRPTEIEERENEPSAPPYEIWTYDELTATRQNNVRFIFYNPSLAPGDYILLHSTARGELKQPQWQRILYKNAPNQTQGNDFLEGTEVIDNFHRSSRRIFGEGGN